MKKDIKLSNIPISLEDDGFDIINRLNDKKNERTIAKNNVYVYGSV